MKSIQIFFILMPIVLSDNPTLKPFQPFNPGQDAKCINDAIDSGKIIDAKLIDILTQRTHEQRMKIANEFQRIYNKNFIKQMQQNINSDEVRDIVIKTLMIPFEEYLANKLDEATNLVNIDEDVYIDVLCPLNNAEKSKVIEKYTTMYGTLCDDVNYKVSNSFGHAILSICASQRKENLTINANVIEPAANKLIELKGKAFKKQFEDDLSQYTRLELQAIYQKYEDIQKQNIIHKIKDVYKWDTERAYVTTVRAIRNRAAYFAERVHECVDGPGTYDDGLQTIVFSRCEIDLQDVKIEYQRIFQGSMRERVDKDVLGNYGEAMLQLIGPDQ